MKAREAIKIFERAKETGFCASLRGFAKCVGVVPSTIVNWKNNPEKELRDIETIKVQYVKEEAEKFEPEFVDWSSFRREAAKDILVGLCANNNIGYYGNGNTALASSAIVLADELIKQLKQE